MDRRPTEFTAFHPDNYDRQAQIHVTSRKPLGGGTENKEVIKGTLKTPLREVPISLVRRNFEDREKYRIWRSNERNFAELTLHSWRLFKEAGLPTYDTLRIAQDGSLLVTDVCADGSRAYGNEDLWVDMKQNRSLRSKEDTVIDNIFINLTSPENIGIIENKAKEIGKTATDKNIRLPGRDALELVVHPDGTWDLLTLDVREAHKSSYPDSENTKYIEWLINDLKTTREALIEYQKKTQIRKLADHLKFRITKLKQDASTKIYYKMREMRFK